MRLFEEENNVDKEEILRFGEIVSGAIRMLGVWMSPEIDNKNRIQRTGGLWRKIKTQLKKLQPPTQNPRSDSRGLHGERHLIGLLNEDMVPEEQKNIFSPGWTVATGTSGLTEDVLF